MLIFFEYYCIILNDRDLMSACVYVCVGELRGGWGELINKHFFCEKKLIKSRTTLTLYY